MGDEGHNRNRAGSLLYLQALAPHVARGGRRRRSAAEALDYLGGNALAVLNPVMAACKLIADAAHGVAGSTLVSAMARNGTDFGIRVSGLGDRWFTAPSPVPDGLYFAGYGPRRRQPRHRRQHHHRDRRASAPSPWRRRRRSSPSSAARPRRRSRATLEMYEITVAEHPHFTIPPLGFRGTPTGIDVRKVVELGITAARQHRHRPPRGGRRPDRRRPGAAADGDLRGGAGRVAEEPMRSFAAQDDWIVSGGRRLVPPSSRRTLKSQDASCTT